MVLSNHISLYSTKSHIGLRVLYHLYNKHHLLLDSWVLLHFQRYIKLKAPCNHSRVIGGLKGLWSRVTLPLKWTNKEAHVRCLMNDLGFVITVEAAFRYVGMLEDQTPKRQKLPLPMHCWYYLHLVLQSLILLEKKENHPINTSGMHRQRNGT